MAIAMPVEANATTSTSTVRKTQLPAGMTAVLIGVSARAQSVTSDPAIIVGNTTDTDGYVASANLTTLVQRLSVAGALTSSGRATLAEGTNLVVTVTNDTGDGHGDVDVQLYMYVVDHATNIQPD